MFRPAVGCRLAVCGAERCVCLVMCVCEATIGEHLTSVVKNVQPVPHSPIHRPAQRYSSCPGGKESALIRLQPSSKAGAVSPARNPLASIARVKKITTLLATECHVEGGGPVPTELVAATAGGHHVAGLPSWARCAALGECIVALGGAPRSMQRSLCPGGTGIHDRTKDTRHLPSCHYSHYSIL